MKNARGREEAGRRSDRGGEEGRKGATEEEGDGWMDGKVVGKGRGADGENPPAP